MNGLKQLVLYTCVLSSSLCCVGQTADDFAALSAKAARAREADNVPAAIDLYRQAVKANPKWQEGWWFLGSLLYDTDQYTAAREALETLSKMQERAAPVMGLLGLCEFETGAYASSLEHIEQSLALGTAADGQMEPVLRYHEALLLTKQSEFDRAVQAYAQLVRSGAQAPAIPLSVGLAALRTPMLPKEIPADEQDLYTTAGKAVLFTVAGDFQNAQGTYRELLNRHPRATNVHYLYGCFLLARDPDSAVAQLKEELAIAPANPAAAAMVAWTLLKQGDYHAAMPLAEKAAVGAPNFAVAQFVFGRLLVESGAVDRGIARLETAEKIDPVFLETHLSLATAYSRIGRTADAQRERQLSLNLVKGPDKVAQPE